jgi:hypothetical protein
LYFEGFQTRLASSQAPLPATKENLHYGSVDGYFEKVKIQKDFGEPNNRDFAYFVVGGARMAYASVARLMLIRVSFFMLLFLLDFFIFGSGGCFHGSISRCVGSVFCRV